MLVTVEVLFWGCYFKYLEFNQNIVEREYYVNDYGNQFPILIIHYLRIREKFYDESPLDNPDLYPGDYLKI